jgi:dolichol-phosphate mannosyltransferase
MIDSNEYIDIIIPVYNEGENILSVLHAFEKNVQSPIRILICYDYDHDSTLPAINQFKWKFEIIFIKNKFRFAHGAVMTGIQHSDAPAVISYMADDDYNAGLIDRMIHLYRLDNDVVCPSRFIKGGSMVGCPWLKSFLVRFVSFSLYYFAGLPCHDSTNAFRLFSRRLINVIKIESTEGFTYSIEILAKAHRLRFRIAEIPAQWYERTKGTSRFQVGKWAFAYLRWYFYVYQTTYLTKH